MDAAKILSDFLHYFLGDALFPEFAGQLLLFLLLVVIGAIVLGNFGSEFGAPYLFWHENPGKQFAVGVFLALTVTHIIFIGFMVDFSGLEMREGRGDTDPDHWSNQVEWLTDYKPPPDGKLPWEIAEPRAFLWYWGNFMLLTGLISALAFLFRIRKVRRGTQRDRVTLQEDRKWLPLGFAAGTGIILLTLFAGTRLVYGLLADRPFPGDPPNPGLHWWHLITFVMLCVIAASIALLDPSGRRFSPAVLFLVQLSLLAAIFGTASYVIELNFDQKWGGYLVALILVLILAVAGLAKFRYQYRNLNYRAPREWTDENANREPEKKLLTLASISDGPAADKPLVVICTSGGGITAMSWTVAVLNQLEKQLDGFPYAVRMINGASGGMVGAAAWVSTLKDPGDVEQPSGGEAPEYHCFPREELFRRASEDSLSPAVQRMILHDLPLTFLPISFSRLLDRGNRLEDTWNENLDGAMEIDFNTLRDGEAAGWRPSMVFSPMIPEEGRRLIVSNLDYSGVLKSQLKRVDFPDKRLVSVSGVEFLRMCEEGGGLRISSSSRMNATFPFLSPAAYLPVKPERRVVDAGYYDNWGVNLAARWMLENADEIEKRSKRILVIEIDAYARHKGSITPESPKKGGILSSVAHALEGMTAPFQSLVSARQGVIFRNDEQMEALENEFLNERKLDFTSIRLSNTFDASLSWYLTKYERDRIADESEKMFHDCEEEESDHMRHLMERTQFLKKWWEKR